ncbi:peptidoglycan D,D-transpeptidase FtsI family protein [Altererythrobacter sp. CAU 1778]
MNAIGVTTAIATGRGELFTIRRRYLATARLRVFTLIALFCLIALGATARIAWIGIAQPGTQQVSLSESLLPPRGEIADRNGVPLARAFPSYALWFNPEALGETGTPLIKSPEKVAAELAAIFPDINRAKLVAHLKSGKPGYLRRQVLPEQANKVIAIGELGLELPRENDRFYPQGSMAAHILGYVAADGHGRVGMEQVLDKRLNDPATRGTPVQLSIDMRVQGALEDELGRAMLETDALGAAGVILDVDTGEVMALASLPEFDPNQVVSDDVVLSQARMDTGEMPRSFNRVTNQVYELGSTFKPLTVAAAIDAGMITDVGRRWQASRPLMVGGNRISDSHTIGASLNVPETLIHSSNIVSAQIAGEVGGPRLKSYFAQMGMDERAQIELPARGRPLGMNEEWNHSKALYAGFGHGIAVTPLHLASAYAAMVNGGIWRPATLYRVEPGHAAKGRRVFKASTSARMNQLMRMIALYGTGRNADAPGFRVGGKTGSAEKPGRGGYRRTTLVSTFAAAFPMDRPRFVVIAMLDEPKGTAASSYQRTAAWNAAPVVGRVVPRIGPLLGVMPDDTRDVDITDLRPLVGDEG